MMPGAPFQRLALRGDGRAAFGVAPVEACCRRRAQRRQFGRVQGAEHDPDDARHAAQPRLRAEYPLRLHSQCLELDGEHVRAEREDALQRRRRQEVPLPARSRPPWPASRAGQEAGETVPNLPGTTPRLLPKHQ